MNANRVLYPVSSCPPFHKRRTSSLSLSCPHSTYFLMPLGPLGLHQILQSIWETKICFPPMKCLLFCLSNNGKFQLLLGKLREIIEAENGEKGFDVILYIER